MTFDSFTQAFIDCLLWSENDDDGESLDIYSANDIAPESLAEIVSDCEAFQRDHSEDIGDRDERAGHDFCLTRNRHGAGFWDGDWAPEVGRRLTDASHIYGTMGLYVGDNGKLYTHG